MGALSASGSSAESISLTAPATAGSYYYGACVDMVTGESDTTNNCSSSVEVAVLEPVYPDLEVRGLTVDVDVETPRLGGSFSMAAILENSGDGPSATTMLRFYRSADKTITRADTQEATVEVSPLEAGERHRQEVDITAPSTEGTYYYGACVDPVPEESDTSNNCSWWSMEVPVPLPRPNLVVGTPSVDNANPATGATFTLSATVINKGDWGGHYRLHYYRSTDATITWADTQVRTGAASELFRFGTRDHSIQLTAPSTAGTYYYGACVEGEKDESDTTDNCSVSVRVDVL